MEPWQAVLVTVAAVVFVTLMVLAEVTDWRWVDGVIVGGIMSAAAGLIVAGLVQTWSSVSW